MYVPTTMGDLFDFPWNSSAWQVVSNANVQCLYYYNDFAKDFPGTPSDNFALNATGDFVTTSWGSHSICTASAGDLSLYLDGRLLVRSNFYPNSESYPMGDCQSSWLEPGIHTITVNYVKRTGSLAALMVYMDGSLIVSNGKPVGPVHLNLCLWVRGL